MSCRDVASAQSLADKLGDAAKITLWERKVTIFEDGTIRGEGECRQLAAGKESRVLNDAEIPKGTNGLQTGRFVELGVQGAGNWSVFSKIKMKITSIDADGWLMGKYVNGELQVVGNTNVAQKWDYIVKADGQILVGRKHSWLSQGEDVLAAGELKYNNGKLVEISNSSGHYLPSTSEASNFLRVFRTGGVNVDNATLTILKEDGTIFKQISPTAGDRLTYY